MSTIAQVAWVLEGSARDGRAARFTRLLMRRGETCRIDRRFRRLRVLLGVAWVTCEGVDLLVPAGESVEVPVSRKDFAVMSGVGDDALVVELSG